ncbi:hypothetical protein ABIE56_000940 [Luteibacter sp. 621]|uniref:tail fiber assembly protein n=1 Tax=Luteibacter sp. 621 TaxID=3373916 RepID=UPI003D1BF13A
MSDVKTYAVVQDGVIVNVVAWDGVTAWEAPDGTEVVEIPADVNAGIGWSFAAGVFTAPPPPVTPPTSADQILAENTAPRNAMRYAATRAIPPLQDAVDIGEAIDADASMLKAWKTFRVAVNGVVLTANPSWPSPPQVGYGAAQAPATQEAWARSAVS